MDLRTNRWIQLGVLLYLRDSLRDVPYADVRLYEAMRTWNKLITSQDSENWVQLSLDLGTVIGAFSTSFSVIDVEILKMFFAEL